jgi:hypothetical protein
MFFHLNPEVLSSEIDSGIRKTKFYNNFLRKSRDRFLGSDFPTPLFGSKLLYPKNPHFDFTITLQTFILLSGRHFLNPRRAILVNGPHKKMRGC